MHKVCEVLRIIKRPPFPKKKKIKNSIEKCNFEEVTASYDIKNSIKLIVSKCMLFINAFFENPYICNFNSIGCFFMM